MTILIPNTTSLIRREIPALKSRDMRIAREQQMKRSWSIAPDEFFRIFQDEPFRLEVTFTEVNPSARVKLYSNLLGEDNGWGEIEFTKSDTGRFSLSVLPKQCGIFLFKIKHSPDSGKTWYWDRAPFSKVIIDPACAKDIRMYTLLPNVSGHIGNWIAALDHIRDLGFNMVHLLPITAMGYSESPYAANDLFSIDPSFLDPHDSRSGLDQFEDFVRSAQVRGLRLCIDLVLNHIGISSHMVQRCPEWIVADRNERDGLLRAGCWHMNKWIRWGDLVRIQYDHPEPTMQRELWAYMKQYGLFWANYAAYTGGMVRFDNLHSSDPAFIAEMTRTLREIYPDLILQAEFFSDSNTLLKTAGKCELNLLLANPWEHPFAEPLREYLLYLHDIHRELRFLAPLSTHDTGAPAQLYGAPEAAVMRYFTLALFGTGQTGMVQGTEHGVPEKINFIGRFRKVFFPMPNRFNDEIRKINRLHQTYALFHEGGNIRFIDEGHGAVLAAVRQGRSCPGEQFLLVANLDTSHPYKISLDLSGILRKGTVLHELVHEDRSIPASDTLELEIEAFGMRAYRIEFDSDRDK